MRLTCEQRATHAVGHAARPHLARQGPLPVLRGAVATNRLSTHIARTSSSWPDRHVAYARAEARSRQKATVEVGRRQGASGRANGDLVSTVVLALPASDVSRLTPGASMLATRHEDAQQGTGCSFDQFLPPWRQGCHRMVRGQFAYKVVNACLRGPLHNLDDANIDPPRPFCSSISLHSPAALSASSSAPFDGATPLRGVVHKTCCTVQAVTSFPITAVLCLEQHRRSSG